MNRIMSRSIESPSELNMDELNHVVGGATVLSGGATGPNQYQYVVSSGGYIFNCSVLMSGYGNVTSCSGAGIEYVTVGEPN